jgi:hypothetical protein
VVRECDVTLPNVASRGSGSVTPRPRRSSSLRFHVVCFIRSAERANLGRVHADQAVCAEASNDNGLDAIDAIHAHDLCVDEDGDATARMRAYSPQRPAKVLYPRDWFEPITTSTRTPRRAASITAGIALQSPATITRSTVLLTASAPSAATRVRQSGRSAY